MKRISPLVITFALAGALATRVEALNLDTLNKFDWLNEDITVELPSTLLDQNKPCLTNCAPKPTKVPAATQPSPTPTAKPTPTPTPVVIDVRVRESHRTRERFNQETSYEYSENVEGEGDNSTSLPVPTQTQSQSKNSHSSSGSLLDELLGKISGLSSLFSGWL